MATGPATSMFQIAPVVAVGPEVRFAGASEEPFLAEDDRRVGFGEA